MMGHDVARLSTAQRSAVPCRAITHSKENKNCTRAVCKRILYLIESGTAAFCKISITIIIVHIKGRKRHGIVAVKGISGIAVIQILVVQAKCVTLTTHSKGAIPGKSAIIRPILHVNGQLVSSRIADIS